MKPRAQEKCHLQVRLSKRKGLHDTEGSPKKDPLQVLTIKIIYITGVGFQDGIFEHSQTKPCF